MSNFSDELATLVAMEMNDSHGNPERQALVLERLLNSVSFTVALMAKGDAETTEKLLMGAESYLSEGSVNLSKFGELLG